MTLLLKPKSVPEFDSLELIPNDALEGRTQNGVISVTLQHSAKEQIHVRDAVVQTLKSGDNLNIHMLSNLRFDIFPVRIHTFYFYSFPPNCVLYGLKELRQNVDIF